MNKSNNGFVIQMAFLMSLIALSIDAMLPALSQIATSLKLTNPNDAQFVISCVFLGMSFGLMLYGPLSDAYGRKPSLYLGIIIFILGSILSLISTDFNVMLIGRFLQGFGAAATRVVSMAMIRDKYKGNEMGRIMSLIMVVFILVPALAPSLGQLILYFSEWRSIFGTFIFLGLLALVLLRFNQEETLKKENRIPFSLKSIINGTKETLMHPTSKYYMIASGLVFGAFVGYLSSAQQILQIQYKLGDSFSLYFGGLALCIGLSSYINSKLVMRFGMKKLSLISVISLGIVSGIYFTLLKLFPSSGALTPFLAYLGLSFLFIGILFGTLNTLALEPLGHIAGVANSVISSIQTFLSVGIGGFVGHQYNGSVEPLVLSFFIVSLLSIVSLVIAIRNKATIHVTH
jgi:DHA1 family bicyclomycin/chloramphenicol resistance-like MFS transporter